MIRSLVVYLFGLSLYATIGWAQPHVVWKHCLGGAEGEELRGILQLQDSSLLVSGLNGSGSCDNSWHGSNDAWLVKLNHEGETLWRVCRGGKEPDAFQKIVITRDGALVGGAGTTSRDQDVSGIWGGDGDFWIVKMDPLGTIIWETSVGGTGEDWLWDIVATYDGGVIACGQTNSNNDGDVKGFHLDPDEEEFPDGWIVKLDPGGEIEWQKCLGGKGTELMTGIIQTRDSGYVTVGYSNLNDGDVTGVSGWGDLWMVKLTPSGGIEWQRCYGGSDYEHAESISHTPDGGFVVCGVTMSPDSVLSKNHGEGDGWILKFNAAAHLEWQNCYGGSKLDRFSEVVAARSGYLLAGATESDNGDVSGQHGGSDGWVVRLSSSGELLWQKCLGSSGYDEFYTAIETYDSAFAVVGYVEKADGDAPENQGYDGWVVKLRDPQAGIVESSSFEHLTLATTPNPSHDKATVTFTLPEASVVVLELFSVLGERIYRIELGLCEVGAHSVNVNLQDLAAGTYYCRLQAGAIVASCTIVHK